MSTPNIGWLFYKDYLRKNGNPVMLFQESKLWAEEEQEHNNDAKKKNFEKFFDGYKDENKIYHPGKNQILLGQQLDTKTSRQLAVVFQNPRFTFSTIYPGLTLGTGYNHETGEMGEFKLGFFFDHSTGYPCIPGSTVKGCLRSMFPQKEREKVADKHEKYSYMASVIRDIPNLPDGIIIENDLGEDFDEKKSDRRARFIDFLEREIFDGEKPVVNQDGSYKMDKSNFVYQPISVYERDIFFDGYISSSEHPAIKHSTYSNAKPFIVDDYITPHLNRKRPELSPFTNPVPLMFLKILPKVIIQFQFDLKNGMLPKQAKIELFRKILLDFGVGAKTNVGYGQFDEGSNNTSDGKSLPPFVEIRSEPNDYKGKIKEGEKLEGKVVDKGKVKLIVDGKELIVEMSGNCPMNNCLVNVAIKVISKKKEIMRVGFLGELRQK
jgi:CRISPR-associated protein Cmr6